MFNLQSGIQTLMHVRVTRVWNIVDKSSARGNKDRFEWCSDNDFGQFPVFCCQGI